jgi:hypothetical protein
MTRVELILKGLEGNAEDFKKRCEAKICSPSLLQDLNTALERGSKLSADIDYVMQHLFGLKNQLERPVDNPE